MHNRLACNQVDRSRVTVCNPTVRKKLCLLSNRPSASQNESEVKREYFLLALTFVDMIVTSCESMYLHVYV